MKVVWYCELCNWVSVSDSSVRHDMNYCRCGESAMDLEGCYCRMMGAPVRLAEFENGKWTRKRK